VKNLINLPLNPIDGQPLHKASAQVIRIKPSKCLLMLVSCLHLLIVTSFLSSHLSLEWAQIPIILLSLHLGLYWYQWRRLPRYRLQYLAERWCFRKQQRNIDVDVLETKEETLLPIMTCYYWSRFLVVLIVQDESKSARQQYMPILYDSCSAQEFRFIKVMSKTMLAS
jgi:hypothetical protein